jgi:hypothetical protein
MDGDLRPASFEKKDKFLSLPEYRSRKQESHAEKAR